MRIGLVGGALVVAASLWSLGLAAEEGQPGAARKQRPHVHGVAHLKLAIDGPEVEVELFAPGVTLVGFEHAPQTDMESETLRLARENLRAGDGMIRFNTDAACRLVKARVETDLPEASSGQAHADISAYYRFDCAQPRALDSAALGLFTGFPALQRVLVHYEMAEGRGAAELTRGNPVVGFIPF
ncbi:ZrgA family zinc uptake protein [Thiocystis violacea]|uniref:ZrgA family zinc uptake protein n=1 Tax=Thiocystis violacea TaxID=13725 RepID=UPI00190421A3|nr:DUF2796 domain-containing protein [Thiocystis violacea]MBK1721018.1 hypothetical protein [Thiocystis violacea]